MDAELSELRRRRADAWQRSRVVEAVLPQAAPSPQAVNTPAAQDLPSATHADVDHDAKCCRICFDGEETAESGRLFSPCKCTGSMRYVHVSCLNGWRAASSNDTSYYKCDACHYEYRLQRLFISEFLLSSKIHLFLTLSCFLLSGCLLGAACHVFAPHSLPMVVDRLRLPPMIQWFLLDVPTEGARGNPVCWHGGYTYESCCLQGHNACWDGVYDHRSCCEDPSAVLASLRSVLAPVLRFLCCGCMGQAAVGFALYVWRQVHEALGNGALWQGVAIFASMSSMGESLGRFVALIGSAMALRELYNYFGVKSKQIASNIGDHVLEVA